MTDNSATLRDRKRAQNRRNLAETSLRLALRDGINEVTISDIVAEVNLSRRTFSSYFSCKEEAIAEILLERAAKGFETWDPEPSSTLVELVRSFVTNQVDQDLHGVFSQVHDLTAENPALQAFVSAAEWEVWDLATERLERAITAQFSPPHRERAHADLPIVMGAIAGALRQSMREGHDSGDHWFTRVAEIFDHGLSWDDERPAS